MTSNRVKYLSLLIFFCFFYVGANSQTESRETIGIKWLEPAKTLDANGNEKLMPTFEGAVHVQDFYSLPVYGLSIHNRNISEFSLVNASTEPLSEKEKSLIPAQFTSNQFEIKTRTGYQNKKPVGLVSIIPIRINPSTAEYEKLVSFEYKYSTSYSQPIPSLQNGQTNARVSNTATSVLSSGTWYKIRVNNSGIFKIDHAFLESIGIAPAQIDPRQIRIFGNGGRMLPQANNIPRYDDLQENHIYVEGEQDGVFNTNDYVLFYAQGPDTWQYNPSEGIFNHTKNLYSDYSCYFLTIGPGYGMRVANTPNAGAAAQDINTFHERVFLENDLENFIKSGREWYGDKFDFITNRNYNFNIAGLVPNTDMKVTSCVMGASTSSSSFQVRLNNVLLGVHPIGSVPNTTYATKGIESRLIWNINSGTIGNTPNLNISLNYDKGGVSWAVGYLNYLAINATRELRLYGNQTAFRSPSSTNTATSRYNIRNTTSNIRIWDITDPLKPLNQIYTHSGDLASFSTASTQLKEFVVFTGSNFDKPVSMGRINNQNLHAYQGSNIPDMVIVSHELFLSQANKLAQFRRTNNNLKVEVVSIEQVYNEFSSGAPDVTAIRDFLKMMYDSETGNDTIRYLLLFGDCSYDYKNRIANNTNFVPIYQSRQSLHNINSYSSDDYFGFLDDNEGEWQETSAGNHLLDIGIGRLPVKSITEAEAIVNKLIHYESTSSLGNWRNRLTFVADDGDNNIHMKDADTLAGVIFQRHEEFNVHKIYLDAYPQISSPGGEVAPQVNAAINMAIDKGTLIMNYSGHGGEVGWAQERILDINQINRWSNIDNLTFFITATCEFGRYDNPELNSGAEYALLNPNGGGIGIVTSTRAVFQSSNRALNLAMYDVIFSEDAYGNRPSLGDMIRMSKSDSRSLIGVNNRNYALLADPCMHLAFPKEKMAITKVSVNGVENDTLRALSRITLEGEIRNISGGLINNFNGTAHLTVFDKKVTLKTLGTERTVPMEFLLQRNFIYDGRASVLNGRFNVTFIVPKDIAYNFDYGKISMYAQQANSRTDAHGYNNQIIIGGSDPNAPEDNTPPEIRLYMNDESFVFGGLTNPDPILLAKLYDESGINVAGTGIGHEITAILDNSPNVHILNEYYTSQLDDFTKGKVRYPFRDLPEGNHSLKFKAWDTYNNSSESYIEFVVSSDSKIALKHVLNYPNPFSTYTTFHFDHNRAGDDLDVMVQIYTISGKLIKTIQGRFYSCPAHISDLHWDGRDDFGDKIGKGVYVYKLNVRSIRDDSRNFKYEKLVILN